MAAVAAIVVGIGLVVLGCTQVSTALTLRDVGVTTQASIVDIEDHKGIECRVSYRDSSGALHSALLGNQCRGMQPGQTISVRYLAADPATVAAVGTLSLVYIAASRTQTIVFGTLLLLLGVLVIVACTGALQRWLERDRRGRRDRPDERMHG